MHNKCYLYVISDGEHRKIGISLNPKTRLTELQTGNTRKLTLDCLLEFNSQREAKNAEHILHSSLFLDRSSGEWFSATLPQIQKIVAQQQWVVLTVLPKIPPNRVVVTTQLTYKEDAELIGLFERRVNEGAVRSDIVKEALYAFLCPKVGQIPDDD